MRFQDKHFLREKIRAAYLADEAVCLQQLLSQFQHNSTDSEVVRDLARRWVVAVRDKNADSGGIDAFLREYDLSSKEGVLLLCLAESLLRIPDSKTADQLIKDKLSQADWLGHMNKSQSLFVNAGTWGLMLTGRMVQLDANQLSDPGSFFGALVARLSEPVVRTAMKEAMKNVSQQYVMADTIEAAIRRSKGDEFKANLFSFDMLGEAAICQADTRRYIKDYTQAIIAAALRDRNPGGQELGDQLPQHCVSISVKLSALHPRYEYSQSQRVIQELFPELLSLAVLARQHQVGITLDAEEADRLELMLDLFEQLLCHEQLQGWGGLGLAVQAYQKRAPAVLQWLEALAQENQCQIPVRLVKGAYWDSEIKWAQEQGLTTYPVFTRKEHTDVSYLLCAQILLQSTWFYPQFATHNAHTLACITVMAKSADNTHYELQRLHGMGEDLYAAYAQKADARPCRVYAPVGAHEDLLPYLVRRLLENGANTSFINRISDPAVPMESLIHHPVALVQAREKASADECVAVNGVVLPPQLYRDRLNSAGMLLADPLVRHEFKQKMQFFLQKHWGEDFGTPMFSPADTQHQVGHSRVLTDGELDKALVQSHEAFADWSRKSIEQRAQCLERMAELLQQHRLELVALLALEAGKCIKDGVAEVREAVDFCRYYAVQLRQQFVSVLPDGVTGERNELSLHGRGVFLCISPWNFPLAIFTGQVAAALAAGNTVLAKPSLATFLIARETVRLFHEAGVPQSVLHLLAVSGEQVQRRVLNRSQLAGVAFTGSTQTARIIYRELAKGDGPLIPLVAETGGINTMIVDSSALPQQVVKDVLLSAFNSAGQRCSALRLLCLQDDIAEPVLQLLRGAMQELKIGFPWDLSVDVGPVIDVQSRKRVLAHIQAMRDKGYIVFQLELPPGCDTGYFIAPAVIEIQKFEDLQQEIFGPVLHILRFKQNQLANLLQSINASGYGLTMGLHSRLESAMDKVRLQARVGNLYVNRNMIGATVGVQPFGGEALSGTGPKAGGPHYLYAFATERVLTVNTAAIGGNTQLLSGVSTDSPPYSDCTDI
ncbi:MAG: bifunctional proline dehydrogenase/L-glutamate gamma-semialdehyde dehydrogenase PutA [Gammaproteobacteria bacterium]|nr:bifunctional proline dehydrogenase/L-glutamate gamma-semialdehyde dehydrogenase PutA [Gammaproteobacteria bacterium]MDH5800905.1 bifunctional proline dehydrogenase/L-glutamate gamma-semialdehyde dehydrogenase PutA [Gammaproteobacteria bacterium]